jgi:hypothetical protein
LDAASLEANDHAKPAVPVAVRPDPGHGFERSGGGVV